MPTSTSDQSHEEAVHAQIRDRLYNMKDGRLGWLEKNIDDTLIGGVLTTPAYVSGLTEAEYNFVKLQVERRASPEIIEARDFTQKALAEVERESALRDQGSRKTVVYKLKWLEHSGRDEPAQRSVKCRLC
jgi:hypothetical protein